MSGPAVAGKWGTRATALARVVGRTRHGRIAAAVLAGARATAQAATRALHLLFLQVTGFFFLVFAAIGAFAAWREYQQYAAGRMGPGRALLAAAFTLMFAWFAATSFWNAERKR